VNRRLRHSAPLTRVRGTSLEKTLINRFFFTHLEREALDTEGCPPSPEEKALDTDADNGYILLNEKPGGKVENSFLLTDETNSEVENSFLLSENTDGEVENSSLLSENTDGEVENTYQSTDETPTEQDTGAEDNIFSLIYDKIINGADEIFSIITCALSFALMIIYKKGMMPTLEGGVRSLAVSVKGIGEKATEIKSATDSFASDIADRLTATEKSLTVLADGLNKLTATLDEREKSSYSKDDLTTVMLAEIDMLYEIFNSAELPQYLKEHVGERINEMKKTLKKKDNPNE
jgi:hypothetical protein